MIFDRCRRNGPLVALALATLLWLGPAAAQAEEAASGAKPLAVEQHESGNEVSLLELKRTSGDTLTAKWEFRNTTDREQRINTLVTDECYIVDAANKKKYFVVKDSEGSWVAGKHAGFNNAELKPGEKFRMWAKFPAPPTATERVTLYIPGVPPLEDVPISK